MSKKSNTIGGLKKLKPISSIRCTLIDKSGLWKGGPYKPNTVHLKKTGGRNNRGVITCRHRGGGHKKLYRIIDFHRDKHDGQFATVERLEYDPNRTAFIALLKYENGHMDYILAPDGLNVGDKVSSGKTADILPGHNLSLNDMPIGTKIHNVELVPNRGGILARSAGTHIKLAGKEMGFAILNMPSGESRKVSLQCRATVGIVSNLNNFNQVLGKAGRNRMRGWRPENRGIARNPVDHPNGGRTHGGKIFSNPWGTVVKGQKTRRPKPSDKLIIKTGGKK